VGHYIDHGMTAVPMVHCVLSIDVSFVCVRGRKNHINSYCRSSIKINSDSLRVVLGSEGTSQKL